MNYCLTGIGRSFLVTVCISLFAGVCEGQLTNPISVQGGSIAGYATNDSAVSIFKGIPFAAPPVGGLRWKAPQSIDKWEGIKSCVAFESSPMQPRPIAAGVYTSEFLIPDGKISEDCLYLNVWTGARSAQEKRPVLVWLNGGTFTSGGSAVPVYDGEALARKGVIFVSINYRLGIFGFLAHPDLTKESDHNVSGNYGLLDQLAALRWVQKNIAAFGGDSANITIAGQAAGAMSANCLVASPLAKGLFQRAIAESGSCLLANSPVNTTSLQQAEQQGMAISSALHTFSISLLRNLSAQELTEQVQTPFGPITDGHVLSESIADVFIQAKQAKVDLLLGWNAEESFNDYPQKKDEFQRDLQRRYGAYGDEFLRYYPALTDEQAAASQAALDRDITVALPVYKWAQAQSRQEKSSVYVYHFAHKPPATGNLLKYGAFHGAEVAYALNNLPFLKRRWQAVDHALTEAMASYWVNFVKTGNPNGDKLPEWPRYTITGNDIMLLDENSRSQKLLGKEVLDFLASKVVNQ